MSAFRKLLGWFLALHVLWEVEIVFDGRRDKTKKFLILSHIPPTLDWFPEIGAVRPEGVVTNVSIVIVKEGWM